jgi:hypothetical protein
MSTDGVRDRAFAAYENQKKLEAYAAASASHARAELLRADRDKLLAVCRRLVSQCNLLDAYVDRDIPGEDAAIVGESVALINAIEKGIGEPEEDAFANLCDKEFAPGPSVDVDLGDED